jgi:4-hydroxybenzoate polyprenyltransferase
LVNGHWKLVISILDMIRFSHTVFALPFALLSATLAWGEKGFSWLELAGILLCMVFARSAAMAFNRLADRHFDAANPRTAGRHLPTGRLRPTGVWLFTLACSLAFIGSTAVFLLATPPNPWPLYLALPVLAFLFTYSFTKRFTALSHFWLGTSLFLAPVAAWIAIRGIEADFTVPLLLGLAVLSWVAGFDIIYACQDVDFDRRTNLRSIPARLGVRAALRLALGCHVVMIGLLMALVWAADLGPVYAVGVLAVALLIGYEHWLVRPEDLSRVNQAFFHVNGVVSVGLFLVVLLDRALTN